MNQQGGYGLVSSRPPEAGTPIDVATAAARILLLYQDRISIVGRSGDTIVMADLGSMNVSADALLGFDGNRAYVGVTFRTRPASSGLMVFSAADLGELARYATSEAVLSVAEAGGYLVLGMASSLAVAPPACPSN